MSYRDQTSYNGVVCGLCQLPPKEPYGILGWVFDKHLISCMECRKQQGQDSANTIGKVVLESKPKILDRMLAWLQGE